MPLSVATLGNQVPPAPHQLCYNTPPSHWYVRPGYVTCHPLPFPEKPGVYSVSLSHSRITPSQIRQEAIRVGTE